MYWKQRTGYIACEVSKRPFPPIIREIYSEIITLGLAIQIIVAYPEENDLSAKDYRADVKGARKFCIGLLSVTDQNNGELEYPGIPVNLHLPPLEISRYRSFIRSNIQTAYHIYIHGDPKHGVQELGQLIENAILNIATQAKANGSLSTGGFQTSSKHYPLANLIDDLMTDRIIDNAILGRCRGFVDDRNSVSHKPKSMRQAVRIHNNLRDCFRMGLQILEELPEKCGLKCYKFRV